MTLKSRVEAVLFITGRAVQVHEIAEILNEPDEIIEEALLELMFDYSAREGAFSSTGQSFSTMSICSSLT